MPFDTGTATDHNDLLDQLNTYLTGLTSPWTELDYTAGPTTSDPSELYIEGPGAGAGKRVTIGIRTYHDAAIPVHGWEIRAMTGWDAANDWDTQENISPSVYLNMNASSQGYWFFANDRRFIVVSAVGGVNYCSAYAGMFMPLALPDEYPQPLYIGAPNSLKAQASVDNSGNRFLADPGNGAAYYLPREGLTWRPMKNHAASAGVSIAFDGAEPLVMWPHRTTRGGTANNFDWNNEGLLNLRPNAAGEYPLFQSHIVNATSGLCPGALDGVFSVPGFGLTSTQQISAGARDFRVFPNIFRTGNRDFMAIEEVA